MDVDIQGKVEPGFENLAQVFKDNWARIEVGASVCVFYRGRKIVDLWGGFQDRNLSRPWQEDTLVNTYSITKGIVAIALAILFERQQLDYSEKVAAYWPEFSQSRKQHVTVAQLLSHQAGLCGFEKKVSVEDLYDWKKIIHLLEKQEPIWKPGEISAYHPITWGFLAGELIRRISGLSPGQFIDENICEILDADFYLGLPESEMHRVADVIGPNHARIKPKPSTSDREQSKYFAMTALNPLISPYRHASSNSWRRAEIPSANGQANARGIATVYAAVVSEKGVNGEKIIGHSALAEATRLESDCESDPVLNKPIRFARGFMLNTLSQFGPCAGAFGHDGTGGSIGFADPDREIGFAYISNQMESDSTQIPRSTMLIDALYASL